MEASTAAEVRWKGASALYAHLAPIGELRPDPRNPNVGNVEEIVKSLERFGQTKPVVARQNGMLVAGHHVTLAAERLGWTHVAVIRGEFETEQDAIAFMLADNRLAALATLDDSAQLDLLVELGTDLSGTGYSVDDVEDIQARAGAVGQVQVEDQGWQHSEDEDSAAARAERLASGMRQREFVLMEPESEVPEFVAQIELLQKRYGLESRVQTVRRAVAEEAGR